MPVLFEAPSPSPKKSIKKSKQPIRKITTPLTAYLMHPKDVRFETQADDEEVILFMRQHIIVFVPQLIMGVIFFFIPIVVFPFLLSFIQTSIEVPGNYIMMGTIFWYLALFGYLLTVFIQWYFNIFIVTNHRIIDIDFLYLLYKKFAEAKIEKIQDVSFRTGGIVATMFNYGDVLLQTASEVPNFVFEKVPRPSEVVHVVSDLLENAKGSGDL